LKGLFITPGHFAHRAAFYQQLGELLSAGFGLIPALDHLKRNPPDQTYRQPTQRLLEELAHGMSLSESLRRLGPWLPEFDVALIHAAEQSGRLDVCFRLLASYYSERARMARQLIADLAYPAFLFHFAIFIFPFAALFQSGNWIVYLAKTFGILIPLYAVVGALIYATQGRHGERWRGLIESLLHRVPVLGPARRSLALSRLASALEALLRAGVTIIEAWELAANACGSPALRQVVAGWLPNLRAGKTPAETLANSGAFPELFASQYTTGEISGQLDDTLSRLHKYYSEEGWRKLHAFAQWTPRAIYLIIALAIAYHIVQFWVGHFRDISNAMGP
jgi:type II secretory pathway component PulF